MKNMIISLSLLMAFGSSTAMADILPEGEKIIPACAKLVNTSSFENTTFLAAIYSEGIGIISSTPDKIEVLNDTSCLNTGNFESAEFFAVDTTAFAKQMATSDLTEVYNPTNDINAYPLAIGNGIEFINTYDERVDITNQSTTMTREYLIGGIDNSKRVFYVNLVARTTDVMTEDLVPTNPTPENLDRAIDISTDIFTDVDTDEDFAQAIVNLKRKGVIQGYDDGSFKPYALINRAEFTKIVIASTYPETQDCAMTTPTFTFSDVVMDSWYADFVCMAFTNNIIAGYPDGTFKPEQNINYAEAAKITTVNQRVASGENDSTPWYKKYTDIFELIDSTPSTITSPDQLITRGEMALMMYALQTHALELQ